MKKIILFALFALSLAAGGLSLVACGKTGEKGVSVEPSAPGKHDAQGVAVTVEPAVERQAADTIEAVGTVRSAHRIVVSPQIMGRIVSLNLREGDRVKAGQVVAEIDDSEASSRLILAEAEIKASEKAVLESDAALEAAKARDAHAAATAARYKKLLDEKVVSPQEYESVDTQAKVAAAEVSRMATSRERAAAVLEQAKAAARTESIRKDYSKVKAASGGIIVEKKAESGDMAMPGTPLMVLEGEGRYRLEAMINETDLASVRLGAKVMVMLDAIPGKQFSGRVAEIVPAADPASRTFTVKIDVPRAALRSGLYGKAVFEKGTRPVLSVPARSITEMGGIPGVFVVTAKGEALFRAVKVGRTDSGRVEILAGVATGERVVVSGVDKLTDGAKVQIR